MLRERRFSIDAGLAAAFGGETVSSYESAGEGGVDVAHGGAVTLPSRFLEIYVPIRGTTDGAPFGVYEVYQDAQPIEDQVEATRRDVFIVAVGGASFLLVLLWLAFASASRRLAKQNRLLRERARAERLLATDLRRSEERFRSLVRNSTDIILILRADRTIAYESPAVASVLGYSVEQRVGRTCLLYTSPSPRDS